MAIRSNHDAYSVDLYQRRQCRQAGAYQWGDYGSKQLVLWMQSCFYETAASDEVEYEHVRHIQ